MLKHDMSCRIIRHFFCESFLFFCTALLPQVGLFFGEPVFLMLDYRCLWGQFSLCFTPCYVGTGLHYGDHSLFPESLIWCWLRVSSFLNVLTLCRIPVMMVFWVNLFPAVCNFCFHLISLFDNLAFE